MNQLIPLEDLVQAVLAAGAAIVALRASLRASSRGRSRTGELAWSVVAMAVLVGAMASAGGAHVL
ncbi:MAG TPA: hypothetical protein VGK20_06445 [Candidatus Binatia bacterium]